MRDHGGSNATPMRFSLLLPDDSMSLQLGPRIVSEPQQVAVELLLPARVTMGGQNADMIELRRQWQDCRCHGRFHHSSTTAQFRDGVWD